MLSKIENVSCVVCGGQKSQIIAVGKDYLYATTEEEFSWVKCNNCGHLYLNPRPSKADLGTIYPSNLMNYVCDRKGFAWYLKRKLDSRQLRKLAGAKNITSVLDVGCADGELLRVIRKMWGTTLNLEGTELSSSATLQAIGVADKIHYGEVSEIQHGLGSYDLIFMQQVVEHLIDPETDLMILLKHLNHTGLLIVETPLQNSWDYRFFLKFAPGKWEGFHIPRHFNIWSQNGFEKMVSKAGGEIVKVNRKIKPVHWTVSIQNQLNSKGHPAIARFFSTSNIPLLCLFAVLDVFQLVAGRGSDVRYVIQRSVD